jgi:L-lactate dehydrogenase complex protein LldF
MKPVTKNFDMKSKETLLDPQIQKNLAGLYGGFHSARIKASSDTADWEELQTKGREIKKHVINHLDQYLELLESNVISSGGNVHFAETAEDATKYVINLARKKGVRTVVKSKSMLSEEMSLNEELIKYGIDPYETDLGEYIVQLAEETPYHIIAPAIHKSRQEVSKLFADKIGTNHTESIETLTLEARDQLRDKFIQADMGITGGNFLVAETGTLALVSNEGNGRMCTSMPPIHVAIVGMEKIIPSMEDLGTFLRLLIRSATGQWISSYVTMVSGPRGSTDIDGPEEFHLVIVDNGRSKMLADPHLREALYCLRCGACLNACPVYRKVGGHSYGWVYPGPIGSIVSPILTGLSDAKDLPFASSLCGACKEACPVKIDIPRMLLYLRNQLAEGKDYPDQQSVGLGERVVSKFLSSLLSNSKAVGFLLRSANLIATIAPFVRKPFPPSWTKSRESPTLAKKTFVDQWVSLDLDGSLRKKH